MMEIRKKQLTRVRLINWHYFENETMSFGGSTLVSGENTAGKSTILDAIQLVLTTNTRKFNVAANEKGNRDLRGYVRCKVGNVGETYLRKDSVIANIALEFFEEKTGKYFVLGVHMSSPDEESPVVTKWYMEECRLEALAFLTGKRPSLAEEFQVSGKRVKFIEQKHAAKDRFKRRMGNLEERFFDIIPKSLAFKPMDNVKDFINKFVLSEEQIDVAGLRANIETLSELEDLIQKSQLKLDMLTRIVAKYEAVKEKDNDILINEFLLSKANLEHLEQEMESLQKRLGEFEQYRESNRIRLTELDSQLVNTDDRLIALNVAANSNDANHLVERARQRIRDLTNKINEEQEKCTKLKDDIKQIEVWLRALKPLDLTPVSGEELKLLGSSCDPKEKVEVLQKLVYEKEQIMGAIHTQDTQLQIEQKGLDESILDLQNRLRNLENRKLDYPEHTKRLKAAIEEELKRRGIVTKVYVVCELLEIIDETWKNAVEGYFHTQKFNLIVEPDYYDSALAVYKKNQNRIHTAGIVNTRKIKTGQTVDSGSLAYVVHSENRYAKAYADYVLGRVMRCDTVEELENHKIAITASCMLYQGFVVRNLDGETYKNPYIGQHAYRTQIVNTKAELQEQSERRSGIRTKREVLTTVLEADREINLGLTATYINAPFYCNQFLEQQKEAKKEEEEASKDPTYIQLKHDIDITQKEKVKLQGEISGLQTENIRLEQKMEADKSTLKTHRNTHTVEKKIYEEKTDANSTCKLQAEEKYALNRRSKAPLKIMENFSPQRAQYGKEREELLHGNQGLQSLQEAFNYKFDQDFLRGMEGMNDYIESKAQLESVEILRFEEKLKKTKEDCEEVFKSDFLSKMKNNIENARSEFKSLNKALQNIYYGEDSYHFLITFDKRKESLYRMITSENNMEGQNLWTQAFEAEYKEEMEALFEKLVTKDDHGDKVIQEYTDYRSYLDYDIEIHKKNGTVQRFSAIYGEKSGSETQVPYYVAIAASFYQLYRLGNSVRLMLLDEAFDKMDDERIASMMEFFNSLDLQVIMATPPAKIEIIGEKVKTILTAIRVGANSIVEEYDF